MDIELTDLVKIKKIDQKEHDILFSAYTNQHPIDIQLKIMSALDYWLNIPNEKFKQIAEITELTINSCLMFYKIEEDARREKFGLPVIICSNHSAILDALTKTIHLGNPKAVEILNTTVKATFRSFGMQLHWERLSEVPSKLDLAKNTANKWQGLNLMPFEIMQLFSTTKMDCSKMVMLLGVLSHVWDNFYPYTGKKPEDPCEKVELETEMSGLSLKKKALSLESQNIVQSLEMELGREMIKLGPNPLMEELLQDFALREIGDE